MDFRLLRHGKKERSSKQGRPLYKDVSHQVKLWFLKRPGAIHKELMEV